MSLLNFDETVSTAIGSDDISADVVPQPLLDSDELVPEIDEGNLRSKWLLWRWVRGQMSAKDVVTGAAAGARDPDEMRLGQIAYLSVENAHRDLTRLVLRSSTKKTVPIYEIKAPILG